MSDCGVVDRQYLQYSLSGLRNKVYHLLQVAEVANAKAALRAKREYRHESSSHLGVADREESLVEIVDRDVAIGKMSHLNGAVHACFPYSALFVVGVDGSKLKLYLVATQRVGIDVNHPFVVVVLSHLQSLVDGPSTQHVVGTCHHQSLVALELWRSNDESHHLACLRLFQSGQRAAVYTVGES